MARQYDLFYSAQDRSYLGETALGTTNTFADLNGAQKIEAYPVTLAYTQVNSFHALTIAPRFSRVKITDATTSAVCFATIEKEADGSEITLRPINTAENTVDSGTFTGFSREFATGSTITQTGVYQDAAVCIVDLREAPADVRGYSYLLLGAGWVNFQAAWATFASVAPLADVGFRLVGPTTVDDPFGGDIYTPSNFRMGNPDVTTSAAASTLTDGLLDGGEAQHWNVGGIVDLEPGGLYVFRSQFACTSTQGAQHLVQVHDSKLAAVRFDRSAADTQIARIYDQGGGSISDDEGDGKTEFARTNDTASLRYYLQTPENVPAGGTSRLLASMAVVQSSTADTTDLDAAIQVRDSRPGSGDGITSFTPMTASDTLPSAAVSNDNAGGKISLRFETNSPDLGTVVTLRYGFGIICTPLFFAEGNLDGDTATSSVTTTSATEWATMEETDDADRNSRSGGSYYWEMLKASMGRDSDTFSDFAWTRFLSPNTNVEGYADGFGRMGNARYPDHGTASAGDSHRLGWNFLRSYYPADIAGTASSGAVLKLQGRTPNDAGGAVVSSQRATFGIWKERSALTVPENTPLTVVAKLNTGMVLRSGWTVGTSYGDGSNDYAFTLSLTDTRHAPGGIDQILGGVTRLLRNGVELVETTKALYDAGTFNLLEWYFDRANRTLHLRMGGSSDNSSEPWDDGIVIVATVPLYYGRQTANLVDPTGTTIPYTARLQQVPGASAQLSTSSGVVSSGTSLGSITLINSDGHFDDLLVRRVFEGYETELLVGHDSISDEEADFVVYQSGTQAIPQSNFDTVTLKLMDRLVRLDRELVGSREPTGVATVQVGDPSSPTEVENQSIPAVYGRVKRLPAYRTTNNTSGGSTNDFVFTSSVAYDVTAVHYRQDDRESEAMSPSSSRTNAALGKVVVSNHDLHSASGASGSYSSQYVPDVVYVDCWGQTNADDSRPLLYPGEILRHLIVNAATGLPEDQVDRGTFDLLDDRWRKRMATIYDDPDAGAPTTTVGARFLPSLPVATGGVFQWGTTIRRAAEEIAASVFCYLTTNRAGRLSVGVADYRSDNLLRNGSFDNDNPQLGGAADTSSDYLIGPWRPINDCVAYRTAAEGARYLGQFGLAINSATNERAAVEQTVEMSVAGTYLVTLMAKLDTASTAIDTDEKFRIALVLPDGSEILGEAQTVETSGAFGRITQKFAVPFGSAGLGKVRLYPYYADDATDATNTKYLWIDTVEAYRVVAELTESNIRLGSWQFGYEIYDAVLTSYDTKEGSANPLRIKATNSDATGLYSATPIDEVGDAQPTAGMLVLDHRLADATSAAGVAAVTASYYAHQRCEVRLSVYGLTPMRQIAAPENELEFRFPVLGDRVYVRGVERLPVGFDASPIWRVDAVNFAGGTGQEVQLTISQAVDPIDRTRAGSWT